jgi:tripartite-type tricarboxylate transporter receptor subunit TctC
MTDHIMCTPMQLKRLLFFAAAIFITATAQAFAADAWPQRPVRFIVPFGAGSSPDVAARLFGERLRERWRQPVVIENRPGADGVIGTAGFAAMADDHALLFSPAAPITVYPLIQDKLSYDPARDIVPISATGDTFPAISVSTSLNVTTMSELVALARSQPGRLNWATAGGALQILFAGFVKSTGIHMVRVAYRDQNLAIQDVAEGRVQVITVPMTPILPLVQAGKIRVLAVTTKRRSPLWPDIPTATEAGYAELAFEGLIGLFGPRGIPDARRERISKDIEIVAADQVIAKRLAAAGQSVRGSTPAGFAADIEEQRAQIAALVKLVGKPEQ